MGVPSEGLLTLSGDPRYDVDVSKICFDISFDLIGDKSMSMKLPTSGSGSSSLSTTGSGSSSSSGYSSKRTEEATETESDGDAVAFSSGISFVASGVKEMSTVSSIDGAGVGCSFEEEVDRMISGGNGGP